MARPSDPKPTDRLRVRRCRPSRACPRACRRGFTVIELIVAMTLGLIVAMAAFALARNASQLFLHEARISGSRLGAVLGLTRLQEDLRRASLQSSPNAKLDPSVCAYSVTWPAALKDLAGIRIEESGSSVRHPADLKVSTDAGLTPDALIVGGMLASTEHYSVAALEPTGGGGYDIFLELDGAYWRTKLAAQSGGSGLDRAFAKGRYVRVVDADVKSGFGTITGFDDSGTKPRVSIGNTPALAKREKTVVCGCEGHCTGALISPITRALYDLRAVTAAAYPKYAGIHSTAALDAAAKYYKGPVVPARTELVRVELDVDDAEIAGSLEVVAEYAVDLKFGVTVTKPGSAPDYTPVVTRLAFGDKAVYAQTAKPTDNGNPQYVSAVQVRLSTRAPFGDRRVGLAKTENGGALRIKIGGPLEFARLSTLSTEVYLSNQAAVDW